MNIVFIVDSRFPYGTANSMRARNIYNLLKMCGHSVHVISDFETADRVEGEEVYSYDAVYNKPANIIRRHLVPYKSIAALKKHCRKNKIQCVLTNARFDRLAILAKFCKKSNIKLIVENCEWYDNSSFKLKWLDPRFYKNEKMMRYDFRRVDGFISISRLLHNHNEKFGKKSVRIPTILDVENTPYSVNTDNKKIQIVYTGSPGRSKEFLLPVIKVLADNSQFQEKIEFHIYGPSYNEVMRNIGNNAEILQKAGSSVIIHGRIPQDEVQGVLTNADYLIFLRPDRRSSNAGFPTKLGECFAVGTPVIANNTGDLSLYIKNGENGYLLNSYSEAELIALFEKLINISKEQYFNLRKGARNTAEESFDYRKYVNKIRFLLEDE